MATGLQRQHAAGIMRWLIANEQRVMYRQARPMISRNYTEQSLVDRFRTGGSIAMDCSEAVTFVCRCAGLADPNGASYDGSGYTGTMLAHLPHYSDPKAAGVGALVVFVSKVATGDHVAQVLEPGADPVLFSHGQDAGPIDIPLSGELAAQRRMHGESHAVFLSIAAL